MGKSEMMAAARQFRMNGCGRRWLLAGATLSVLGLLAAAVGLHWLGPPRDLAAMEARVSKRWPRIAHLPRSDLSRLIGSRSGDVVLFDVREPVEFEISHLPGAIRVDPRMTREAFLAEHAAALGGKTAVFYCAVGIRSSKLAKRLGDALERSGVARTYNLAGGIFGWHNDALPLVNAAGATDRLHYFHRGWLHLLARYPQPGAKAR